MLSAGLSGWLPHNRENSFFMKGKVAHARECTAVAYQCLPVARVAGMGNASICNWKHFNLRPYDVCEVERSVTGKLKKHDLFAAGRLEI